MLGMKKSRTFAQPNFIASFSVNYNQFGRTNEVTSDVAFHIGVRLGAVEQMLRDNKVALNGGAR